MRALLKRSRRLRGVSLPTRIELSIAGDDLRFWSPQLVVDLEDDTGAGTVLRARFGPDPYVWGLYVLSYIALSLLTLLALAYGFSQWTLGQKPTGFYFAPLGAIAAALVYGASFVGQGLAADQLFLLRKTLGDVTQGIDPTEPADAVGEDEPVDPEEPDDD